MILGMKVNALDLSPNFAGTLMGITNGIGALTGIAAPYVVGVLTPNRTLKEWRMVFFISCAFLVLTNTVYLIWASAKTQWWNDPGRQAANNKTIENGNGTIDEREEDISKEGKDTHL